MDINQVVSVADYESLNGFGGGALSDQSILEDLNKAITTGYDVAFQTGGGALRPQSLESTLKVLTFQDKHVKLWKKINKIPAYSTAEEYNQLQDYGSDQGGFFQEGGLPNEEDTTYQRQVALVKFLGTTRVVTHPATLVRSAHGDILALEARNGTLWIMRAVEKALFFGNSAANSLEFDGFDTQLTSGGNIIDAHGQPLTEALMESVSSLVASNYGLVTDCFLSLNAIANVAKAFFPKERMPLPTPNNMGAVGVPVTHFNSQNGAIEFSPDVFIKEGGASLAVANVGAPATTGMGVASGAGAGSGYHFLGGIATDWKISAVNANGETLAVGGSIVQTPTVGQRVALTITLPTATPTQDQPAATAFKIYRQSGATASFLYLKTVYPSMDSGYTVGNATFTVYDDGAYVEGCSKAFFFDMNPLQVMAFKQLAPIMKLPLATVSAAIRFMVLLYGTPILYAPKKGCIVINVGNSTTSLNV